MEPKVHCKKTGADRVRCGLWADRVDYRLDIPFRKVRNRRRCANCERSLMADRRKR